jgi:hypothetical protein
LNPCVAFAPERVGLDHFVQIAIAFLNLLFEPLDGFFDVLPHAHATGLPEAIFLADQHADELSLTRELFVQFLLLRVFERSRASGRMRSANNAMVWASSRSFFANRFNALAKLRTSLGLTMAFGREGLLAAKNEKHSKLSTALHKRESNKEKITSNIEPRKSMNLCHTRNTAPPRGEFSRNLRRLTRNRASISGSRKRRHLDITFEKRSAPRITMVELPGTCGPNFHSAGGKTIFLGECYPKL